MMELMVLVYHSYISDCMEGHNTQKLLKKKETRYRERWKRKCSCTLQRWWSVVFAAQYSAPAAGVQKCESPHILVAPQWCMEADVLFGRWNKHASDRFLQYTLERAMTHNITSLQKCSVCYALLTHPPNPSMSLMLEINSNSLIPIIFFPLSFPCHFSLTTCKFCSTQLLTKAKIRF